MFIRLHNEKIVALNLNSFDSVQIYEYNNGFILGLSKQFEPPINVKTTIQSYLTYDQAFADFESMVDALAAGKQVWSPQQK